MNTISDLLKCINAKIKDMMKSFNMVYQKFHLSLDFTNFE